MSTISLLKKLNEILNSVTSRNEIKNKMEIDTIQENNLKKSYWIASCSLTHNLRSVVYKIWYEKIYAIFLYVHNTYTTKMRIKITSKLWRVSHQTRQIEFLEKKIKRKIKKKKFVNWSLSKSTDFKFTDFPIEKASLK